MTAKLSTALKLYLVDSQYLFIRLTVILILHYMPNKRLANVLSNDTQDTSF